MKNKIKEKLSYLSKRLIYFVCLSLCSSTLFAQITLDKKNKPMKEVLKVIEQESSYKFFFSEGLIGLDKKVTLKVTNSSIDKVMSQLLDKSEMSFEKQDGDIILLVPKKVTTSNAKGTKHITGVVREENGEVVIGASIKEKGTNNGTVSDIDGKFSLSIAENGVLQISYLGFLAQEIVASGKSSFEVSMKEDAQALGEVVVVGFGSQKKINLTGSVATVSSEAFEGRAVQNATMMLQGIVPGLNINKGEGTLDGSASINIRGLTTIGEGSSGSPLILIDGMEGDLNIINPQDIESISVLKDAAASSIYGSRAPFGVILITTKSGKDGRFRINYNNSFRWNTPSNRPKVVDSYTFATYFNDAAQNSKQTGHFTPERMQRIRDYMDGKISTVNIPDPNNPANWADGYDYANANIDWWDEMYDNWNFTQEHTASMAGGTEKLQMYASVNYLGTDGMIKVAKDTYKRYATNLRVTSQLTKQVHIDYNIRYSRSNYDRPSQMGEIYKLGYQTWPMLPVYDDNGHLFSSPSPIIYIREGGRDKTQLDGLSQQAKITLKLFDALEVVGQLNYSFRNIRNHWDTQKVYNHNVAGDIIPNNSSTEVKETNTYSDYINPNVYATYGLNIADAHNIKIMGGFQSETGNGNAFSALRHGVIIPGMDVIKGTSGTDGNGKSVPPSVSGTKDKWSVVGFFGRLNYNWKERYLAEFNMRYDGTSRFRSDKRWKTSPSGSIGWNIAKEDFWKDFEHIVHMFKLRGSYGVLGNQNTSSYYPTYVTMPIGTANGGWIINGKQPNTSSSPALINSEMTWETVKIVNAGLDLSMLSNKFNLSFDWYQRNTENMIGPAPELPAILGTGVPRANNTDLRTRGWELSVSWRDQINKDFGYYFNFSLSDDLSTITNYPNDNYDLGKYYKGQKIGQIWGYETVGIAKTQEEMDKHLASLPNGGQNPLGSLWEAGDIMYKDLNGDGVINNGANTLLDHGDLKVIGNNAARYRFGLTLGGSWKNIDLSMFFQGVMKRDYWEGEGNFWGYTWLWRSTAYKEHMDYFRADSDHLLGENINSYYPRPFAASRKNHNTQTKYLQNASYIRLKNLNLGYTLDNKWLAKTGLSKVRVFLTGENLWTGTKLKKMLDPEAMGYGTSSIGYPLSQTLSFGVSVTL